MRSHRPPRSGLGILIALISTVLLIAACSRLGIANRVAPTPTPALRPPAQAGAPILATATVSPPTAAPASPTALPATVAPATATPSGQAFQQAVDQYTQDWEGGKYADLYQTLSKEAQSSISQDKFVARYTNIASGIDQTSVVVTATLPVDLTPTGTPPMVTVPIAVTYNLAVLGPVTEANSLPLVSENGQWKVAWTPGLIFKDLTADRLVRYDPVSAARGSIVDRNGNVLAQDGNILTVGVVPGEIKDEATMLKALSDYLKMPSDSIKKLYANAQPDWFVPIKDLSDSDKAAAEQKLGNVLGVSLRERARRVYPYGAATADFVGYVSPVEQSDLKTLGPKGYDVGDYVGRAGLESWGEKYLLGQKGATLAIVNQDGSVVRTIAQKAAKPGDTIITSVDVNYQIESNKALGNKPGSLILMNPSDNTILALASNPSFDPNQFVLGMTDAQWSQLNSPSHPLLFRPAQGLYPTGSIFKVITMSAALEKGVTKPSETFNCGLDWNGLPGVTLHNWTAEGTLNLIQALTGSCDPTFYTLGLRLNQLDPNILPNYARAFGLGKPTGATGVDEASGLVPDPAWKAKNVGQAWYDGDGVNLAIGQGFLLATPLQMANVYSTLANHGTIRNPVLVTEIKSPDGAIVQSFTAQVQGTIPVSPQNLSYVIEGMSKVTNTPLGTAYYAWKDSKIPMEAKTGSAENETSKSHAWFVGYTPPDHANLLSLVMLEGGGLGGEFAAPVGRQIVDYAVAHPVKPIIH